MMVAKNLIDRILMIMNKKVLILLSLIFVVLFVLLGVYCSYRDESIPLIEKQYHSTVKNESKSGYGIDLSNHNKVKNWSEIEADFIILKATEGSTFTDKQFASYRAKAIELGIPVGAYHFMTTSSSADKQFKHFSRVVGDSIDIIPVLDVEIQTKGYPMSANEYFKHIETFVDMCKEYYGVKPIIYSSQWFYKKYNLSKLGCLFWSGDVDCKVNIPYVIHQQTIKAVPGVAGKVDYDVLNPNCSLDTILYKR
jgi:lysozyme